MLLFLLGLLGLLGKTCWRNNAGLASNGRMSVGSEGTTHGVDYELLSLDLYR